MWHGNEWSFAIHLVWSYGKEEEMGGGCLPHKEEEMEEGCLPQKEEEMGGVNPAKREEV